MNEMNVRKKIDKVFANCNRNLKTREECESENLRILENLSHKFSSSIKIEHDFARSQAQSLEETRVINCHAFTFGVDSQEFIKMHTRLEFGRKIKGIPSDYVIFLINARPSYFGEAPQKPYLTEIQENERFEGCLVLYLDENENPKHSGILLKDDHNEEDRWIIGRWGDFKAIFIHKSGHVPSRYGKKIRYYLPLLTEEREKHFKEFCEDKKGIYVS